VLRNPEWTRDHRFATFRARKENEDELDALVAEWTTGYTAEQVMAMMQAEGVPAGVAQTAEDVHNDPQLKHRAHFVSLTHSEIGPHLYQTSPYHLSKTPAEMRMAAPCIGEHNEYVYKELLGISDDEIANLVAEGVFE
jgi:benzylsuccinate CoA-transferase BbsF subunit